MGFERIFLIERLVTVLAFEWLFLGMCSEMSVSCRCQGKPFTAHITFERPLACMFVPMCLEVALLVEPFAAEFTLIHANIRMGSHVVRQVRQLLEPSSTLGTLMWLLSRVGVPMDFHIHLLMKPLVTEITGVRLVVTVRAHMSM